MTQITPDSDIYILSDVNLKPDYHDTYTFPTVTQQELFFKSKMKYHFEMCAPLRIGESVRISVNANSIYSCSYMMFRNNNYSNKWFYAFITDVNWISINDCSVSYQIDDIQTWYFEAQFPPCFVEREHVNDDTVGANLVPENLELGEYEVIETLTTGKFNSYSYMAACSMDKSGNPAVGGIYSGLYNGLSLNIFDTPAELNTYLQTMTAQNKASGVVSITMFPTAFLAEKGSSTADLETFSFAKLITGNLNGYVPKNQKLFTYPYNLLYCTNNAGSAGEFRYEDFLDSDICGFTIYVDMSCNPTAICAPLSYKGSEGPNWNEKITMDGFPQCSWTTDTFKAWLAQNGSSTAIGMMSSAMQGVGQIFTGNLGGLLGTATSIAQTVAQVSATAAQPPQAHGATAGSALVATHTKDFFFYRLTLKKEFLRVIDDYFSMFGYAVHEVKSPNRTGRTSWNYVKTQECTVIGSLPAPAARNIESMFNSGIRLWHGDYIGEYFRDNSIIGGNINA